MKFKRFRGGAWNHNAGHARCAFRLRFYHGYRDGLLGFRCCFSPLFIKIKRKIKQ